MNLSNQAWLLGYAFTFILNVAAQGEDPLLNTRRNAEHIRPFGSEQNRKYYCLPHAKRVNVTTEYLMEYYKHCKYIWGSFIMDNVRVSNMSHLNFLKEFTEINGCLKLATLRADPGVDLQIQMTNLKIIRGRFTDLQADTKECVFELQGKKAKLYDKLALIIYGNQIRSVSFPKLTEISAGNALIGPIPLEDDTLQYDIWMRLDPEIMTINWTSIFRNTSAQVVDDFTIVRNRKIECDPSCNGRCWAKGPGNCQAAEFTCAASCYGNMCYGEKDSSKCCDKQCAGGCTGPTNRDCNECISMTREISPKSPDTECVEKCQFEPKGIQNDEVSEDYIYEFRNGPSCQSDCPERMFKVVMEEYSQANCLLTCPKGYKVDPGDTSTCIRCEHENFFRPECNRGERAACSTPARMLTIEDVRTLGTANCTSIYGNIHYFTVGTVDPTPAEWKAAFGNVDTLFGYLAFIMTHNVTSLDFLSNLVTIKATTGYLTSGVSVGVYIQGNDKLESIGMKNLKRIYGNQRLVIANNPLLEGVRKGRFAEDLREETLFWEDDKQVLGQVTIQANGGNVDSEDCSPLCFDNSCWAAGDDQCVLCNTLYVWPNNTCTSVCDASVHSYIAGPGDKPRPRIRKDQDVPFPTPGKCVECHPQCGAGGCTGPEPTDCLSCKGLEIFKPPNSPHHCVEKCPPSYYQEPATTLCKLCPSFCNGNCQGNSSVAPAYIAYHTDEDNQLSTHVKGCDSCNLMSPKYTMAIPKDVVGGPNWVDYCVNKCDIGFYEDNVTLKVYMSMRFSLSAPTAEKQPTTQAPINRAAPSLEEIASSCMKCVEGCAECTGKSHLNCTKCLGEPFFKQPDLNSLTSKFVCSRLCARNYIATVANETRECVPCHKECHDGCTVGNSALHCLSCSNFKIAQESDNQQNATYLCVTTCNTEEKPVYNEDRECVVQHSNLAVIMGPVFGSTFLLLCITCCVCIGCWRNTKRTKRKQEIRLKYLNPQGDVPPTNTTDQKPDMALLRIVQENELRKGVLIGSGAFGAVYRGVWKPANEKVHIPVAIKVLHDKASADKYHEFIDEARVMASVNHPCCIRLAAVCMGEEMSLVTQFLPCGSLLDYIRKDRKKALDLGGHGYDTITSKHILTWCFQIADGMDYLESVGIVHRDLACRNVLVQSELQVRITDFGLSKILNFGKSAYEIQGGKLPIKWLAIECIKERVFTHQSDVWSFGICVWEMLVYGERPYDGMKPHDVPEFVHRGGRLAQPASATIEVYTLLTRCWFQLPHARPTFAELKELFYKFAQDPGSYLIIPGDIHAKPPLFANTAEQNMRDLLMNSSMDHESYPPAGNNHMSGPFQYAPSTQRSSLTSRYASDPTATPQPPAMPPPVSFPEDDYLAPSNSLPRPLMDQRYSSSSGSTAAGLPYLAVQPVDEYLVPSPKATSLSSSSGIGTLPHPYDRSISQASHRSNGTVISPNSGYQALNSVSDEETDPTEMNSLLNHQQHRESQL